MTIKIIRIYLFTLVLFASKHAYSQDIIVKMDGDEIKASVQEITLNEVKYFAFSPDTNAVKNVDSVKIEKMPDTLTIAKTEVFMIRYRNGSREVFSENLEEPVTDETNTDNAASGLTIKELETKGELDAERTFDVAGATVAGIASGLICNSVGVVPVAIIMATPPDISKKPLPNTELNDDPNYRRGYERKAHQKKIRNATIGYLGGCAAFTAVYFIIVTIGPELFY